MACSSGPIVVHRGNVYSHRFIVQTSAGVALNIGLIARYVSGVGGTIQSATVTSLGSEPDPDDPLKTVWVYNVSLTGAQTEALAGNTVTFDFDATIGATAGRHVHGYTAKVEVFGAPGNTSWSGQRVIVGDDSITSKIYVWTGAGAAGGAGETARYIWTQATAAATWTITHPLSDFSHITFLDAAGRMFLGPWQRISNTQISAGPFSPAQSGTAHIS